MSEIKRSLEDIRLEYSQICSQAGHIQYQISALNRDLELLNEKLKALNLEATKLASEPKEEGKSNE